MGAHAGWDKAKRTLKDGVNHRPGHLVEAWILEGIENNTFY